MAPSFSPAALPAVTRPWERNGVRSSDSPSSVVPGRGGSSAVARPQPSSAERVADRHQRLLDHPVRVRGGDPLLALQGERVSAVAGDAGEAVVQVLRGRAHHQRRRVDQLLRHDPRVGVDALAHRVVAHVLDPAGDGDVVGAEGDAGRGGGHRGHGPGAHPVDGVAGHGAWAGRPAARRCGRWSGPGRRSGWWRRWPPRRRAPAGSSGWRRSSARMQLITRSSARVSL